MFDPGVNLCPYGCCVVAVSKGGDGCEHSFNALNECGLEDAAEGLLASPSPDDGQGNQCEDPHHHDSQGNVASGGAAVRLGIVKIQPELGCVGGDVRSSLGLQVVQEL